VATRTARWTTIYNDVEVQEWRYITRGVLHYRGGDGIPGDMGRGLPGDGRLTLISKPLCVGWGRGRGGKTAAVMARDDRRGNGAHQDGGHPGIVCSAGG